MKILYLIIMTALIQIIANARMYFLGKMSKRLWLLTLFGVTLICVGSTLLVFNDMSSQELVIFLSANVTIIIMVAIIRYVRVIRRLKKKRFHYRKDTKETKLHG